MKPVTEEHFKKYRELRKTDFNMRDIDNGAIKLNISRSQYIFIMKNYEELKDKYGSK